MQPFFYILFYKIIYFYLLFSSPLLFFVQVIFVLTTSGSIFVFLVNIVALFGEEEAPEKQNQKNKNNDRWIKLK